MWGLWPIVLVRLVRPLGGGGGVGIDEKRATNELMLQLEGDRYGGERASGELFRRGELSLTRAGRGQRDTCRAVCTSDSELCWKREVGLQ